MELKGKQMKVNLFTLSKKEFDCLGDLQKDGYLYFMNKFNKSKHDMIALEEEIGLFESMGERISSGLVEAAYATIREDQDDAIKYLKKIKNDAQRLYTIKAI